MHDTHIPGLLGTLCLRFNADWFLGMCKCLLVDNQPHVWGQEGRYMACSRHQPMMQQCMPCAPVRFRQSLRSFSFVRGTAAHYGVSCSRGAFRQAALRGVCTSATYVVPVHSCHCMLSARCSPLLHGCQTIQQGGSWMQFMRASR
jgi:hypothetical protein